VLAAGQIMRAAALPAALCSASSPPPKGFVERGGSAIIAPDGRYLAGPIFEDELF
jgi:hypothetical protein